MILAELEQLESQAKADLASVADAAALEQWRIRYLGMKGQVKAAMARLKDVPRDQKPAVGQRLNALKAALEAAFAERQNMVARAGRAISAAGTHAMIDVTEPGLPMGLGRRHVLSRTIDEIADVFARMGFSVAHGPELEDERHNFDALNIPRDHPARDPTDNFYLDMKREGAEVGRSDKATKRRSDTGARDGARSRAGPAPLMLRSQTSTVQIRTMEKTEPPLKIIAIGRVYRPDTHDATHFSMFHQVEGLYVDRGVTMVDLKTTLFQFARAYFGEQAEVRMRPSFFPFTEPSAEVDIKMKVRTGGGGGEWKWVELGGCGMVDPNVFEAVGYHPEVWTGFAFGLGIERIAMRKYGIADIRWLFENDVRFLRQF